MLYKIGFIILSIGVMAGNSEKLLIPAALVLTGAVLILIGSRLEADNEK